MRLICVILLISTLALLFHTTVADIDEEKELAKSQLNDDDTSLFRGVENAIDEDSEDDAYRILKSLQDVRDDDIDEDEEFNPDSNEEEEGEEGDDDNDILFDEDEDEDQDEDEDDFSADLPEFKNEETADFFEHLPQQPIDNGDNKLSIVEDNIEEEEVDDELDELTPKHDDDEEEEEEEEEDNEEQIENSTPTPVLPPIINENIPWQRPEPVMKADDNSNFYQDINYKESEKLKQKSQIKSNFQFWHLFFIFMILAIVYNSITKRKPNNFIELPSSSASSSSLSWGNKDEKDYLPLHSNNKRNGHYKYEIKSS